mmetsp:Transcript_3453/g.7367  ORF Transcript_3453/g.7367 Transcript_3453/m.7367 type:complete len:348 (+) Transcript_3453:98-1141(+)
MDNWAFSMLMLFATMMMTRAFSLPSSQSQTRRSEFYPRFFDELPSMSGKTVVVTGASRGLGYVTALTLAKKGATLFLLNRKSAKSDEAFEEIAQACTGCEPPILVECDMMDFASVRKAAAEVKEKCANGMVDVLCCNAGIMMQPDQASKDGYDMTIATNVLSHFLLTKELLPDLERAASARGEARVVSMSSGSGFGSPPYNPSFFEKKGGSLGGEKARGERYHQSKLANLAFTSALHDKLQTRNSAVKALACTPGVCATDMYIHVSSIFRPGEPVDLTAVRSVEDGSLAQLKCICDPSVQSGELWVPPRIGGLPIKIDMSPPNVLVDGDVKSRLWVACEQAIGKFEV